MNYLLIYLKFIDQIIVNHDKHRHPLRHSPSVLRPKSRIPTVNAPIDKNRWYDMLVLRHMGMRQKLSNMSLLSR